MASFLSDLFGGGAEKEAADKNRAAYQNYYDTGTGTLATGYGNATKSLDQAYQPLAQLGQKYGAGTDLYLNALGVNGADAAKTAQQSFTTGPGYQQGIDAGLDAINRRRAASGMLASGNSDIDAQTLGQNAQNQQYNSWLSNLSGLISPEVSATTGASGVKTQQAALDTQNATDQIGLLGNYTSGTAGANNYEAAGAAAGAKNVLGAGLSLASLAAGGMGGGGLGSALGSLGGGGSAFGAADTALNKQLFPGYGTNRA